jgi:hypothetical protein
MPMNEEEKKRMDALPAAYVGAAELFGELARLLATASAKMREAETGMLASVERSLP